MQPISPSASDRPAPVAQHPDSPGVRIPPPIIVLGAFLIGWALQSLVPLPFLAPPVSVGVGIALGAAGALFIAAAIPTMLRGHGTLNTAAPSASLVTSGPYRLSRNPMYLGLVLLYAGVACAFAIVWALPLVIPVVLYIRFRVIAPEERYLDRAFGDAYRSYRTRVRRWL